MKRKDPVVVFVEVAEPVVARRVVVRRVALSPALADVPVQDLADLATDLGLRLRVGIAPDERPAPPRNGTCLR